MTLFGLKQGQDLENRVAHPHQEFPRGLYLSLRRLHKWISYFHSPDCSPPVRGPRGPLLESPDNQRARKAVVVYMQDRRFNSF